MSMKMGNTIPVGTWASRRRMARGCGSRSSDWPSRVLHDVSPQMEPDGLDRRRLNELADYIETLPLAPRGRIADSDPEIDRVSTKLVDGRTPCVEFMLLGGGSHGFGDVYFKGSAPRPAAVTGYALSGYGIVCWGWGTDNGMANVALNGRVNEVQRVLSADPVLGSRQISWGGEQILPQHVAQALRFFLDGMTPTEAWEATRNKPWVVPPKELREPKPEPEPELDTKPGGIDWNASMPAPKAEATKSFEVVSMHNDPVGIAHDAYLKALKAVEEAQEALDHAERELIICKLQRGDGLSDIARDHEMATS